MALTMIQQSSRFESNQHYNTINHSHHLCPPTMSASASFRDFPPLPSLCRIDSGASISTSIWPPKLHDIHQTSYLEGKNDVPSMSQQISPKRLESHIETQLYQGLTQSAILQHWMKSPGSEIPLGSAAAVAALQDAVIVSLDAEWYEHDDNFITELGASVLDPRFISQPISSSAWDILSSMENHHVRIKPHAHLINKDLCKGYPEAFQFGWTTFVHVDEARAMLHDIFTRRDEFGNLRPVIFVGHAIDNDYEIIKSRFGLDLQQLGTIVATIDTQVLAVEHGLIEPSRKMRLSNLLAKYNIEEPYLHNAGNDIVCTMIAAFLMVCSSPENKLLTNKLCYADLTTRLRAAGETAVYDRRCYGSTRFCEKCDSQHHTASFCGVRVFSCEHCMKDPLTKDAALTHRSDKCLRIVKEAALLRSQSSTGYRAGGSKRSSSLPSNWKPPCDHCIASTDPRRYNDKNAYSHSTGECFWLQ